VPAEKSILRLREIKVTRLDFMVILLGWSLAGRAFPAFRVSIYAPNPEPNLNTRTVIFRQNPGVASDSPFLPRAMLHSLTFQGVAQKMPYFVYSVGPGKRLEHLDTFPKYREAREYVRNHRGQEDQDPEVLIRMMHANNQAEAEKLLLAPRDNRIIGDD
jgi:hypothetical protein